MRAVIAAALLILALVAPVEALVGTYIVEADVTWSVEGATEAEAYNTLLLTLGTKYPVMTYQTTSVAPSQTPGAYDVQMRMWFTVEATSVLDSLTKVSVTAVSSTFGTASVVTSDIRGSTPAEP